jgi:2,4-dienoyl-CoA reductase-like NADH-dependent reductase (Old Yellow Enzyme family)
VAELVNPFTLRGITFRNRIFVSPMCQYSAVEGMPNDWHFVHLGSRAVGGAGLVMVEATAVSPEGRISPQDTGLWSDAHIEAYRRIAGFVRERGAAPGIQLAHAGRKGSTRVPWKGGGLLQSSEGPWQTVAPSAIPFGPNYPVPKALTEEQIEEIVNQFRASAALSVRAGFDVVEIHMAHGYLLHEFLSPISNRREDRYGGDFENRTRFPLRVAEAVREQWPKRLPLFVRISATDWVDGGWDIEQSVRFSSLLRERGVDLIDCSSGGISPTIQVPVAPGYQVPFAERIRKEATIATGAVGLISEPHQAEQIIASGRADAVFLARAMLRDPYWALHAAQALSVEVRWPDQYLRAVN